MKKVVWVYFVIRLKFLLLLVISLQSCNREAVKENSTPFIIKDSINILLKRSKGIDTEQAKELLNRALLISKKGNADTLRLKVINKLAVLEYKTRQYEKFKAYSNELIKIAEGQKDTFYLAKGLFNLGSFYSRFTKIDSAYYYFNESKELYKIINDSSKVGSNLLNMSIIQTGIGDYYGAERTAVKGLSYLNKRNNHKTIRSLYNNLGIIFYELKQYKEGLYWYQSALELTKKAKAKAVLLNNIGIIYRDMESYDKAISYFEKALTIDLKKAQNVRAMLLDNLGFTQFLKSKQSGLKAIKEGAAIRKIVSDYRGKIVSDLHLGIYYHFHKDTLKAFNFSYSGATKS